MPPKPRSPADEVILLAFGRQLRAAREAVGLSQAELAHAADLHPTYVSGIERGKRNVAFVNIVALANALGIKVEALVRGIG